jgi:hypothetical protein
MGRNKIYKESKRRLALSLTEKAINYLADLKKKLSASSLSDAIERAARLKENENKEQKCCHESVSNKLLNTCFLSLDFLNVKNNTKNCCFLQRNKNKSDFFVLVDKEKKEWYARAGSSSYINNIFIYTNTNLNNVVEKSTTTLEDRFVYYYPHSVFKGVVVDGVPRGKNAVRGKELFKNFLIQPYFDQEEGLSVYQVQNVVESFSTTLKRNLGKDPSTTSKGRVVEDFSRSGTHVRVEDPSTTSKGRVVEDFSRSGTHVPNHLFVNKPFFLGIEIPRNENDYHFHFLSEIKSWAENENHSNFNQPVVDRLRTHVNGENVENIIEGLKDMLEVNTDAGDFISAESQLAIVEAELVDEALEEKETIGLTNQSVCEEKQLSPKALAIKQKYEQTGIIPYRFELSIWAREEIGELVSKYRTSGSVNSSNLNDISKEFLLFLKEKSKIQNCCAWVLKMERDPSRWCELQELVSEWRKEMVLKDKDCKKSILQYNLEKGNYLSVLMDGDDANK